MLKIYASQPVTSDGPMVSRRSSHVVNVVDFLFLLLSLNWIDVSFLYVRDSLVHIECQAVFRPRMLIFFNS